MEIKKAHLVGILLAVIVIISSLFLIGTKFRLHDLKCLILVYFQCSLLV